MNRKPLIFVIAFFLGLQGCAGTAQSRKITSVSPGQVFAAGYINITAPTTDGWKLLQSSSVGPGFAKGGQTPSESFAAQVLAFKLAPTNTPQELEALIKKAVEEDAPPSRFNIKNISFEYSNERSYPCVRYNSIVVDKAPRGRKIPLLLESDGLYCRHPVHQETGFAIIYSHRGEKLYANLRSEAESFIQGVQVPSK